MNVPPELLSTLNAVFKLQNNVYQQKNIDVEKSNKSGFSINRFKHRQVILLPGRMEIYNVNDVYGYSYPDIKAPGEGFADKNKIYFCKVESIRDDGDKGIIMSYFGKSR
jgi:hypothetical protein